MNVFVSGSLANVCEYEQRCRQFVERLGERLVEGGHTVLTGCRGSLDQAIAEAAYNKIISGKDQEESKIRLRKQLISYRLKKEKPVHQYGRLQVSRLEDWNLTHRELIPPEQIGEADVAIFVAGSEGTFFAANWARIAGKPILSVAQFGGSGAAIFEKEREDFDQRYPSVTLEDYDMLSQDTEDIDQLVEDVIALCERTVTSKTVFTIMPFQEEFDDVFATCQNVCANFGFDAIRTDKTVTSERIVQRILEGIKRAAFVIADVTENSPNVFFEIGFAQGLGKNVVITAREEKDKILPFDIADIPIEFWRTQMKLAERLDRRIEGIFPNRRKRS